MAIKKDKMRDIAFYSGFSYLKEVDNGSFLSSDNGFGSQEVNGTYYFPAKVKDKPPYVEYYITYDSEPNTRYGVSTVDQLQVGVTNTYIRAIGSVLEKPGHSYTEQFRVNFIIYGSQV